MATKGVFVITGAGRGLGAVLAREAYHAGFSLALIARSKSELNKVRDRIYAEFGADREISLHVVDLRNEKLVTREFKKIVRSHKVVRALINNAATWTGGKKIKNLTSSEIKNSLDLNFFSAFNATKAFLREYKKAGSSIINIGATSSLQGWSEVAAFSIAKGALRSFSQSLAREMGPAGTHVAHLVIDGLINNERTKKLNPKVSQEKFIEMRSIANEIIHVALQEKSCWTFEWDVRPYNENW